MCVRWKSELIMITIPKHPASGLKALYDWICAYFIHLSSVGTKPKQLQLFTSGVALQHKWRVHLNNILLASYPSEIHTTTLQFSMKTDFCREEKVAKWNCAARKAPKDAFWIVHLVRQEKLNWDTTYGSIHSQRFPENSQPFKIAQFFTVDMGLAFAYLIFWMLKNP